MMITISLYKPIKRSKDMNKIVTICGSMKFKDKMMEKT